MSRTDLKVPVWRRGGGREAPSQERNLELERSGQWACSEPMRGCEGWMGDLAWCVGGLQHGRVTVSLWLRLKTHFSRCSCRTSVLSRAVCPSPSSH